MPFRLTNALGCFKRDLTLILQKYKWRSSLICLDDVIIFYSNVEDHVKHVYEIFSTLTDDGVKLKIIKCYILER